MWEWAGAFGRREGTEFALEYIHAEDEQTKYVCIGPVSKARQWLLSCPVFYCWVE